MTIARARITVSLVAFFAGSLGCGADETARPSDAPSRGAETGGVATGGPSSSPAFANDGGAPSANDPLPPLATDLAVAAEFATTYSVFALGEVPGMPRGASIRGCVVANDDRESLLLSSVGTEHTGPDTGGTWRVDDAGIFRIRIKRDSKGHIHAFDGAAQVVVPSIRAATLAFGSGALFATLLPTQAEWSDSAIRFVRLSSGLSSAETNAFDGIAKNNPDDFAIGIVFPPATVGGPQGARVAVHRGTEQRSDWYDVPTSSAGAKPTFMSATKTTEFAKKPTLMGLAYVPTGSPGFSADALMVSGAEVDTTTAVWNPEVAWAYNIDSGGTPRPHERRAFLRTTDSTGGLQGLHFEPTTGDFLFVSARRLYQVRGFVPPAAPK